MQFYLHVLIPSVPLIPLLHQFPPSPMTGCPPHPPLLPPFFYMSGGSVGPLLSSTYRRIAQLGRQTSRMGYSQTEWQRCLARRCNETLERILWQGGQRRRPFQTGWKMEKCGRTDRQSNRPAGRTNQRSGAQVINTASYWACCGTASGQSRTHGKTVDCRFHLSSSDAS